MIPGAAADTKAALRLTSERHEELPNMAWEARQPRRPLVVIEPVVFLPGLHPAAVSPRDFNSPQFSTCCRQQQISATLQIFLVFEREPSFLIYKCDL